MSYFNSQGVKQWTKRYPTPQDSITLLTTDEQRVVYEECWSIASTLDGGYVLGCNYILYFIDKFSELLLHEVVVEHTVTTFLPLGGRFVEELIWRLGKVWSQNYLLTAPWNGRELTP